MTQLYDLCIIRRSRRLFGLLLERFGVESFLLKHERQPFRLDPDKIAQAVGLAASWLELRTGRVAGEHTLERMHQDLRRQLIRAVAEHLVESGH